jgi:hypothetical protein
MQRSSLPVGARKIFFGFHAGCCLTAVVAIIAGCSARHDAVMRQGGFTRVVMPRPPAFLTGPAALLLTNVAGFSARTEVREENSLSTQSSSSGELLARGKKLLYAPDSDESTDTQRQPGGYSFIWDTAESRGYVLSEALQGYAPVSSALHVTNIEISASKAGAQRISGHPCEAATATVQSADGATVDFELLRALDLKGLPVQIQATTQPSPLKLTFSKIRLEAPPADVFSPPDGFTKYTTPEAMADELAARQNNLKRRNHDQMEPLTDMPPRRY